MDCKTWQQHLDDPTTCSACGLTYPDIGCTAHERFTELKGNGWHGGMCWGGFYPKPGLEQIDIPRARLEEAARAPFQRLFHQLGLFDE